MADPAPAKASNGMLVGSNGMTLYTFDRDAANAGKSACNGPCATLWPPLMAKAGDQPSGAWTIVVRDDGSRQWAYKGKPVYFYQNDKQAGDKTGDNFRDVWHTVKE
jgi:predicted lipoprotein with Yx(FWY)xxD motif